MGGAEGAYPLAWFGAAALVTGLGACSILPAELNFSPLYRHRLDPDGSVREMDVLWPIFHYRKTEDGGDDFRIRPLYRYVANAAPTPATEHQFLAPLGRVRNARGETVARLFPLWRYASRGDEHGLRETDWNLVLLVWGGSREDTGEDYFSVLPLWADIPDFMTYDRFRAHLFPLHVSTEKDGVVSHQFLWPLIGFGSDDGGRKHWHRVLPLYSVAVDRQRYERYSLLWPFVHWGYEGLHTGDPIHRFFLFPLYGRQTSDSVDAWTFLWPFFSKTAIEDRMLKVDVLWPIFRYHRDDSESRRLRQWWVWPLVGHTETDDQRAWTFLWPLIWLRQYDDPEGTWSQTWIVPFYWHSHQDRTDGRDDDFLKIWPLFSRDDDHSGRGEAKVLSLWPWRIGNAVGVDEAYGWLWTLAKSEWSEDAESFALAADLFTTARRAGRRQTSMPFLFNYESDEGGATLRLLQFIPIRFGGAAPAEEQ